MTAGRITLIVVMIEGGTLWLQLQYSYLLWDWIAPSATPLSRSTYYLLPETTSTVGYRTYTFGCSIQTWIM